MRGHSRTLIGVYLLLMLLLASTIAATFLPLGPVKPLVNIGIAIAKAGLIFWFFMHLSESGGLVRLFALAVVAWLLLLFGLSLTDWLTRLPRGPFPLPDG